MIGTLVPLDHALVALLVLLSIAEARWYWPRLVRAIAAGVPGARGRSYRNIVIAEWAFTVAIAALWLALGRPWGALRLGAVTPLRLGIGLALVAAYVVLAVGQMRRLVARPERLARLWRRLADFEPLMPATPGERRGFVAVSLTAGLCEEFVYRGFVMWYAAIWGGPVAAVVISSLVFGIGHYYLGSRHVVRTAVLGVLFALLALGSGSLWPGIIMHAVMDLTSGELGYRARNAAAAPVAEPAAG